MKRSGSKRALRFIEWLAAIVGASIYVAVPLLFAQPGGRDFPLPGLYFVEIALTGVLVLGYAAFRPRLAKGWGVAPWVAGGIILAFVVLGGFSIGPYLLPALLAFLVVGLLADVQAGTLAARQLLPLLVATVVQGVIMLLATLIV